MNYVVDGRILTEEEFKKLQQDPNVKLILLESKGNEYKTLTRLLG